MALGWRVRCLAARVSRLCRAASPTPADLTKEDAGVIGQHSCSGSKLSGIGGWRPDTGPDRSVTDSANGEQHRDLSHAPNRKRENHAVATQLMTEGRAKGPSDAVLDQALSAAALARLVFSRRTLEGLEPIAMQVLLVLSERPGAGTNEIAARLAVEPATLRHSFAELARRGLVGDERDPADSRRRVRGLTSAGEKRVRDFCAHIAQAVAARTSNAGGARSGDVECGDPFSEIADASASSDA